MQQTVDKVARKASLQHDRKPVQPHSGRTPLLQLSLQAYTAVAIFILSLAIQLYFHFCTDHQNCANSCDASEYIRDAVAMLDLVKLPASFWWQSFTYLCGHTDPTSTSQIQSTLAGLHELCQAGPIFPLFIAVVFGLAHCTSTTAPVFAQCILSAASASLMATTVSRAWSLSAGVIAGIILAIYPGFIVNSGRLYSECFSVFLLSVVSYLIVRGFFKPLSAPLTVLGGMFLAALQMTRSLSVLLSAVAVPITLIQQRLGRRKRSFCLLLIGFALVTLPWMALQNLAFGKANLLVDRVGHYNFFIGNNISSQGWLSFPYPDGTGIERKSPLELIRSSIGGHPLRWLVLLCDKTARLYKFPWNDFRLAIGPVPFAVQVAMHQIVLLVAGIGIPLSFANLDQPTDAQRNSRRFLLFQLILSLPYAMFIAVPRYNITAMPLLISFAGGGIALLSTALRWNRFAQLLVLAAVSLYATTHLSVSTLYPIIHNAKASLAINVLLKCCVYFGLLSTILGLFMHPGRTPQQKKDTRRIIPRQALLLVIAIAMLAFPATCLPLRTHGRWNEWSNKLQPGQTIQTSISLSQASIAELKSRQCYLAIDATGQEGLQSCTISVNGSPIGTPKIPGLALIQDYRQLKHTNGADVYWEEEYIFDCLTQSASISNDALRQWWFIALPSSIDSAAQAEALRIKLTNTSDSPITLYGTYSQPGEPTKIPAFNLCSWEKAFYGVENANGISDPRLDERFQSDAHTNRSTDTTSHATPRQDLPQQELSGSILRGTTQTRYNICLFVPDTLDTSRFALLADKNLPAKLIAPGRFRFSLAQFPAYIRDELWIMAVELHPGRAAEPRLASPRLQLVGTTNEGEPLRYKVPWIPKLIPLDPTGSDPLKRFSYPFSPSNFADRLNFLNLDIVLKSVGKETTAYADNALIPNARISIWHLPCNLFDGHYRVR